MAALPELRFEDATGAKLPVQRRAPPGLHPGPVVPPVVIASGAEATSPLRWASSDVYDAQNCATPDKLILGGGGARHTLAFGRQLCGPAGKAIPFDQPPLRVDPTYPPKSRL